MNAPFKIMVVAEPGEDMQNFRQEKMGGIGK